MSEVPNEHPSTSPTPSGQSGASSHSSSPNYASPSGASSGSSLPNSASPKSFPPRPGWKPPLHKRKWFIVSLITLGAVMLFVILLDNVVMPLYVKRGSKAVVPAVVGMKKDEAKQKLSEAGYEPVEYEVRFDDKSPEGLIVRQTPEGGEETKPGRKIYLIISGGKEMAVVPDLRGHTLRDAKIILLKANMTVGNTSFGYSDSASNGTVYQQSPPPGSKTTANTQVSVVVSQGQLMGRVPVPDLAKMTIAQANDKLKTVKLELGKVNYQDGVPESQILDQYPHAGDLVNEGGTVDVWVARGGSGGVVPVTP